MKLCECGCGLEAPIAEVTRPSIGYVKGEPVRFRRGHNTRVRVRPIEERFWEKVEKSDGCWVWTASQTSTGYGQFLVSGCPRKAHRVAYELVVGPIPAGLVIDHLCRNRLCVNPSHLEPVTHRVNILRGTAPSVLAALRTHCVNGHEYTPGNTYFNRRGTQAGRRRCRICTLEANRRSQQRSTSS
jgi:hypothetical protein